MNLPNNPIELFEKKKEIERIKVESEHSKLKRQEKKAQHIQDLSIKKIDESKGELNARQMINSLEKSLLLSSQALPFINKELSNHCPLIPGSLTLIGAQSGTGKSTATAAIAHELYMHKKKTFIISNEETKDKVMARIACCDLGFDFIDYIQNKFTKQKRIEVAKKIIEIEKFVEIMDDPVHSSTIESIMLMIEEINANENYDVVVIDFLQRIVRSSEDFTIERMQALYNFKDRITEYSQTAKVPVIMMTQLKPLAQKEEDRDFETRIKWCNGFYEAAATVIEIIRLRGMPVSSFYLAKGRFLTNIDFRVNCKYNFGRFDSLPKEEFKALKEKYKLRKLEENIDGGDDDEDE
jgi:replicative DNA helicase